MVYRGFILMLALSGCNSILGIGPPGSSPPGDGGADAPNSNALDAGVDAPPGVTSLIGTLSSVGPDVAGGSGVYVVEPTFEFGATVCASNGMCLTGGLTP